jgi:hypothetical protein
MTIIILHNRVAQIRSSQIFGVKSLTALLMSCESFPNSCLAQRSTILSIPTLKQVNDFILPYFDPMEALSGVPPAEEGQTFVYRVSSIYNENAQS